MRGFRALEQVHVRRSIAGRQFALAVAAVGLFAGRMELAGADLSLPVTGEVLGTVVDATGTPQMGAAVQLFNKYRQLISHAATDNAGRFAFDGLSADTYSIRVSVASFLPAVRDRILVKAGLDSVLEIHLATLLSSIEVSYRIPSGAMSEDWKWVLRSAPATRMITRVLPKDLPETGAAIKPRVFSGTHAMLALSGGDGGLIDSDQIGADLGTSFALSTNVLGKNQVQVAGTLGQNAEFGPAAIALCAIYSRTEDNPLAAPPEVTFSMAQLGGLGAPVAGNGGPGVEGVPVLRVLSLGLYQVANLLDNLRVEYGATGESVEYGQQHTSRVSPFARVTTDLGRAGSIIAVYSNGVQPDELIAHQQYLEAAEDGRADDLSAPLDSLSHLPQISDRDGRLELLKTQNYEAGYSKTAGSRTFAASGFYERVADGRLRVAGDTDALNPGNLFSDGISTTSNYDIGRYNRTGMLASVDQRVSAALDLAIAYGRLGGFTTNGDYPGTGSARSFLAERQSKLASVSGRATIPHLGTRVIADYGWTDPRTAIPYHAFTTQNVTAMPGFNVLLRQPLPSFGGMGGRFELTADLRNLLAQGYTPLGTPGGGRLLLVEAPRAIRGGVKFTF